MILRFHALALLCLSVSFLRAQVYISPSNPSNSDIITLTYLANEGNGEFADVTEDIYAHTGLITVESQHAGDWKHIAADWGQNKDVLRLSKVADNKYELKFRMDELYGIGPMQTVIGLAYVFRNKDGTKVGRSKEGGDLYHWFREPSFREPPKVAEISNAPHPDWAKSATIYEVNIRQYTPEGTFEAFAEHLPRLRQMGVDILWFMPIYPIGEVERKGALGSYYSIKDYEAINPEFGTLEDFKRLVDRCHGLGFHVVLDWVANHTSRDHPWIESHPSWYIMGEDGKPNAPNGWSDVAELNFDQYYLREAMTKSLKFWVEECDVDGFRCDVAGEVPSDFWEDARKELDEIKPIWMLAEDASQLHLLNRAFNANYAWPVHHMMNEIAKGNEPARRFHEFFKELPEYYPKGSYPMQFITNHDENSWNGTVFERLGDGHKTFAALTFTLPGIPLIYSGQEAANKKRLEFFERDPIDWDTYSLIDFYTKLDGLKSVNPALWNGTAGGVAQVISNNQENSVLSFVREKNGNKVVSIFNLSGTKKEVEFQFGKNAGTYLDYFSNQETLLKERMTMSLAPWEFKVFVL